MSDNENNRQYHDEVAGLLGKPLLPALVAELKAGSRGDHDYLPIHVVITQANRIFGHGNWNTEIIKHEPMLNAAGNVIGYQCIARVTVPQMGIKYEGFGCQALSTINGKIQDTAQSHDTAAKAAESDAIKRALRYLGDTFGNSLYEKDEERLSMARMAVRTMRRRMGDDEGKATRAVLRGGYKNLSDVPISLSLSRFYEALAMEQDPNQSGDRDEPRGRDRGRDRDRDDDRRGRDERDRDDRGGRGRDRDDDRRGRDNRDRGNGRQGRDERDNRDDRDPFRP